MVSLSTATTDQAAMLLREEAAQYTLLLGILKAEQQALAQGALEDISPTLLKMMGLPQPPEMTGEALVQFE